jgi:repressor LexA
MSKYLNESDKKAYLFIRNRLIHGDKYPTLREINEVTKRTSPRSAVLTQERLMEAGLLKRVGKKIQLTSQSLEDNKSVTTRDVPLVGTVPAGIPMLAEENIEATIAISTAIAKPNATYFLLRVSGTSMNLAKVNGAHINDGDIVLVRKQETADDGEIIVALINDEATVKVLERKKGVVILKPRSSDPHKPIVLTDSCMIQGVVVGVLPSDLF